MSRFRKVEPPPPINPFTGRRVGAPMPPDNFDAEQLAAGQLALTTRNATRDAILAEAAEHPERFRSPLHPTPETLAQRALLRGR